MTSLASSLLQWVRQVAWAPVVVLIVHRIVGKTPWRQDLDFAMHFSGGMAAAYGAWHALRIFERWLGTLTLIGRLLFSFALACVVGLFWEFAELASDVFRGTHIQHNVRETMRDLIADACGAVVTLSLVSWTGRK